MQAGQESKARRGELFKRLPVGYARDLTGKVGLHPDERICDAIRLVFGARLRRLVGIIEELSFTTVRQAKPKAFTAATGMASP